MRRFSYTLFAIAAALALAAIWIQLTSLRSVDAGSFDPATVRSLARVQALGQAAGGALVLGLIVLFGRRDPDQTTTPPDYAEQTRRGPHVAIAAGIVLLGLLPWVASRLHGLFLELIASAPASQTGDLFNVQDMFEAAFWPAVVMAALPGLVLFTIGIVKLQRHRAAPPQPPRPTTDPSDLGTGGPWAMILTAIAVAVGTPLFLRWQLAEMREVVPDAGALDAFQGMFRVAGGIALVFAVVLFLFGAGLLRRVVRDRETR